MIDCCSHDGGERGNIIWSGGGSLLEDIFESIWLVRLADKKELTI